MRFLALIVGLALVGCTSATAPNNAKPCTATVKHDTLYALVGTDSVPALILSTRCTMR